MLYIRHGQKAYKNGKTKDFSLDPGLTDAGKDDARARFRDLVISQGVPAYIVSSPYLRARETAQIANDVILELTGHTVEIIYDGRLGEYLGHHRDKDLRTCLRPETLKHNPIGAEYWRQFTSRIKKYVKSLNGSTDPIWCITHGVVIKTIARTYGYEVNYPCELKGIRVNHEGVTLI